MIWLPSIGLIAASLSMPICPPEWLDREELERQLAIETSSTSVRAVALEIPDCDAAPHTLVIRIQSPDGPLLGRRRASMADIALAVRLRVLAVVIGEMIVSPSIDPEPEPPVAEVIAPPVPLPPPPSRFWSVTASARYLVDPGTTTFGARLGASLHLGTDVPLVAWASAGAEAAYARAQLGSASLVAATAIVGLGLVDARPGLQLAIGPAVEAGWAFITGSTTSPLAFDAAVDTAIVIAELEGRAIVEVSSGIWLEVMMGLGVTVRGLVGTADATDLIGISGPSARLGIGIASDW